MALTKADVLAVATALAQAAGHPAPDAHAAKVIECFEKPEVYKASLEEAASAQAALDAEAVAATTTAE